jgi:hypothetical protein
MSTTVSSSELLKKVPTSGRELGITLSGLATRPKSATTPGYRHRDDIPDEERIGPKSRRE